MSAIAKDIWDFLPAAQPRLEDFRPQTVGWILQRFIEDRNQPGARTLGLSHLYTLRLLQRSPIAEKQLAELKAVDFLSHCKARKASGVQPQTITQDMTYLSGAIKYGFEILEVEGAESAYAAYRKAKPQLVKEQLIAKSQPRTRRPTPEELPRIEAELAKKPVQAWRSNVIPMLPVVRFAYLTARRISETCRLLWSDIDPEKRTCLVRDLKNAKGKGFHGEFPLLGEAWDIVMAQPRVSERIFPYDHKSCGAKFRRACRALGISGLRLHDMRRHCISGMFEQGFNVPEVQKMSLHANPTILLKSYTALRPEDLHKGPAARRAA